jgi:RND superfamily putative drug exporter
MVFRWCSPAATILEGRSRLAREGGRSARGAAPETGAALIIVAVFAGFAAGDLVMFQQMGFGVAVALLIDATIIRSVLVPAAMGILGERNWYLPRWLEWIPTWRSKALRPSPWSRCPTPQAPRERTPAEVR